MSQPPIPVSVLTGFLGSGKTTLLNGLLKQPLLANACVVINEFGEVGIDHLLVERSDENIIELSSGCLCCTIRGDLIDTLGDLLRRRDEGTVKAFDRIVIETTGLADPAPILHVLMADPLLVSRLRLEGVITVVDGVNGMATLDAHPEAVKQVAVADRVVLTKLDMLVGKEGEDMLFAIIGRVRKLAPGARLLTTHRGEATAERLFNMGLFDPAKKSLDVQGWLSLEAVEKSERAAHARQHHARHEHHGHHHHHDVSRHDAQIRSFAFTDKNPVSPQALELFFELLTSYHGPKLLRMKGIIKLSDDPGRPVVIHGVQHVLHPPVRLESWPDGREETRLVFIVKDIEKKAVEELFRAFSDPVTGGAGQTDKTLSLN
ncbi:MAG: GTP-binding protein [Proteobacteria bacterium]|nr:GTP-binding protein [Pseudomonadota bacterium]